MYGAKGFLENQEPILANSVTEQFLANVECMKVFS